MTTQQLGNLNNEQIKMKTTEYQGIQAEVQKTPFLYPLQRLACMHQFQSTQTQNYA